jgi:hypothetical protein
MPHSPCSCGAGDRRVTDYRHKLSHLRPAYAGAVLHFTKAIRADVEAEIEALAAWLGLRVPRA